MKKFREMSAEERLNFVKEIAGLNDAEALALREGRLDPDRAEHMIENVIGAIKLPVGIAENFIINGKNYLVPMAIEESSVVAAASHAAKLCMNTGGFTADADESIMIGQIYVNGAGKDAGDAVLSARESICEAANPKNSSLVAGGGGLKGIEVRDVGGRLCVHLLIDVQDAMGANFVNSTAERVAPLIEELTGGKVALRILSNLAVHRKARSRAVWTKESLETSFDSSYSGSDIAYGIVELWDIAEKDMYRLATHNKGMMNGLDALAVATGNDWRATESGIHSYSAFAGRSLTRYRTTPGGNLEGSIEIPLALGVVGGATKMNPVAQACLKILGVKSAKELACVAASVALANNFAALRALCTEGIQKGHMKLHATNVAHMAGADGDKITYVSRRMIEENNISVSRAKEILLEMAMTGASLLK